MHNSILKNLSEYQRQTANGAGLEVLTDLGLQSVLNNEGSWPRSTIGTTDEKHFEEVARKMDEQKLAPFWIMDNQQSAQQIEFLESNGFREVNRWEGMLLKKENHVYPHKIKDLIRVEEVTAGTLKDWYKIVKEVMLPSKTISDEVLDFWLEDESIHLVVGKNQDKFVTAGMSFMHEKTAGLYFIATLPEFRGKGYASVLVDALLQKCFQQGANEVVLHASEMGCTIYQKLGFTNEGTISTYWKIGRF